MKKIVSLLLVAFLALALAGCNGKVDKDAVLNCISNPEAEGCEDFILDPNDDRTIDEILADLIGENWDGKLTHLSVMMENMDFSEAMKMTTEIDVSVDVNSSITDVSLITTDSYVYAETGTVMQREMVIQYGTQNISIQIIYEEVPTGVIVYLNAGYVIELLDGTIVTDLLSMVDATDDWFMFSFDDSLSNVVEFEVAKDMLIGLFYQAYGEEFISEFETTFFEQSLINLADYDIYLAVMFNEFAEGNYVELQVLFDGMDVEGLVVALDAMYLVPVIVQNIGEYQTELDSAGFDTSSQITYLEENGTELWLLQLSEDDLVTLLDVVVDPQMEPGSPDLSILAEEFYAGTLSHYIVMSLLEDEDVKASLEAIEGLDYDVLYTAMDELDYDAFQMEFVDAELLFAALYEGETEFEAFVEELTATAPETASILAAFTGVAGDFQENSGYIKDMQYAFESLSIFEKYFSMDYYLEQNYLNIKVEENGDFEILTTMNIDDSTYPEIYADFVADTFTFLNGFDTMVVPHVQYVNCPTGEIDCAEFEEYNDMLDMLNELQDIDMLVTYNLLEPNAMNMSIDLADFAEGLIEYQFPQWRDTGYSILQFDVNVSVSNDAEITIPENANDVNAIAEDAARVSLLYTAYSVITQLDSLFYNTDANMSLGQHFLSDYEYSIDLNLAYDINKSYIIISGDLADPDYEIQLYWIDGTKVFDEPVSSVYYEEVLMNGIPTHEQYVEAIGLVDEENFSITKLVFVYLFTNENRTAIGDYIK